MTFVCRCMSAMVFAALTCCAVAAGAAPAVVALGASATELTPSVLKSMVETRGGAIFNGLDKITARVTVVYAPIDVPVRFGSLQLTARSCSKSAPEELPEETVFLEVDDMQTSTKPSRIFTGWMFGSSPALNAVEHPVYDIWLTDCKTNAPSASLAKP